MGPAVIIDDPFCPRHGRESAPVEISGLRCDCPPVGPSCNRHEDCNKADRKARRAGRYGADHCHNDECEDCFGQ